MKRSYAIGLLAGLIGIIVLVFFLQNPQKGEEGGDVSLKITTIGNTIVENHNFNGTALELLKLNHNITYDSHLRCIDDICDNREYYWYFYVNNKLGIGSKKYHVKRGDKLEFRLEKWRGK